jgi:hypothetical protein
MDGIDSGPHGMTTCKLTASLLDKEDDISHD